MKASINTLRFMRAIIPIIGVLLIGMSTGSHLTYPLKDALSTALFIFGLVLVCSLLLFSAVITRLRETHKSFEEIDNNPNYTFKNQDEFNAALYTRVRRNMPDSTERKMILRDMMHVVEKERLDKFIFFSHEQKFLTIKEFNNLREIRKQRFGKELGDCLILSVSLAKPYDMARWINRCHILFGPTVHPVDMASEVLKWFEDSSPSTKGELKTFATALEKQMQKQVDIPRKSYIKIVKYLNEHAQ